jgi:hypothetical protein
MCWAEVQGVIASARGTAYPARGHVLG